MKITLKSNEDRDGNISEEMRIDDKHELSVFPLCDCSEDAIIGRSLVSCTEIAYFMRLAHEAGKRSEEFIVEIEKP